MGVKHEQRIRIGVDADVVLKARIEAVKTGKTLGQIFTDAMEKYLENRLEGQKQCSQN